MTPTNTRTLVLNNDFSAHSVVDWQRAIVLVCMNQNNAKEGAYVVDFYPNDSVVDAKGRKYPVPSVIALAKYVKKKGSIPFSRKNIFIRDKLKCQYCGTKFHPWELTYDHVIPRCKWDQTKYGTPTHWKNIVTCCQPCNRKKAGRTPKEAGMKLLKQPVAPSGSSYIHGLSPWSRIDNSWIPYLPEIYKQEI